MSSLKCLCVQQAFPRSTISTRTDASSSVKVVNFVSPARWKTEVQVVDKMQINITASQYRRVEVKENRNFFQTKASQCVRSNYKRMA